MNINRRQFAGMFAAVPLFPLLNKKDNKTKLTPSVRDQWFDDERIVKELKINLESRFDNFVAPPEKRFKLKEYTENCEFLSINCHKYFLQADIDEKNLTDSSDNFDLICQRLLLCLFPLREHLIRFNLAAKALNFQPTYQYKISNLRRFIFGSNHSIMFEIEIIYCYQILGRNKLKAILKGTDK